MDQHDEAQIDLAHRERRRAFKLLKALRFDEAIAAHDEAISHLEKTQLASSDPVVQQSLLLQIAFHGRQKQLVRYKKELQRNQRKRQASSSFSRAIADTVAPTEMALGDGTQIAENTVQDFLDDFQKNSSIIHSMLQRNDELLLQLLKKPSEETNLATCTVATTQDTCQVIEELRANNSGVRQVFGRIMGISNSLQARINQLETEMEALRLKVRSFEKASMTGTENYMDQSLPDLAPLEIPTFEDFSNASTSLFS